MTEAKPHRSGTESKPKQRWYLVVGTGKTKAGLASKIEELQFAGNVITTCRSFMYSNNKLLHATCYTGGGGFGYCAVGTTLSYLSFRQATLIVFHKFTVGEYGIYRVSQKGKGFFKHKISWWQPFALPFFKIILYIYVALI